MLGLRDLRLHIRVQRVDRDGGWRRGRSRSRLSAQADDQSRCGAHMRHGGIGLGLTVPAIYSRSTLPRCPADVVVSDRDRISTARTPRAVCERDHVRDYALVVVHNATIHVTDRHRRGRFCGMG